MKKVLIIGDSCLDKFVYCHISRICPEAPVPVLNPLYVKQNDGMAGNVFANLSSLGVSCEILTNNEMIVKTRFVDNRSGQMVMRVDENDKSNKIDFFLLENVDWGNYDAIVISDYCKGFLTEYDIEYVSIKHPLTFLDTKKKLGNWAKNIKFIKINEFEHQKNYEQIQTNSYFNKKLIITKGKDGCEYDGSIFSVPVVSVKDVSGAGDTFLAGLVKEYLDSGNIVKSIEFANDCSTKVVQKAGVAII